MRETYLMSLSFRPQARIFCLRLFVLFYFSSLWCTPGIYALRMFWQPGRSDARGKLLPPYGAPLGGLGRSGSLQVKKCNMFILCMRFRLRRDHVGGNRYTSPTDKYTFIINNNKPSFTQVKDGLWCKRCILINKDTLPQYSVFNPRSFTTYSERY